jgi:Fur family ferric uptake transcriptional regulator
MAHPKVEAFERWLAERGLRPTGQRLHLAEVLLSHEGHLTVEELVARARSTMPSIGVSTAWRTISLLLEAGLIDRHRFSGGVSQYEAHGEEHHDHLLCLDCGRVVEVADPRIEARQHAIAQRLGFKVVDHVHEMSVRCVQLGCPHRG